MRRLPLLLPALLLGCAAAPPPPERLAYTPDAAGIAVDGTPLRVDFGRAEAGAVAAVARLAGAPPRGVAACPGGAVRRVVWDDLALHVRDGAFLGWSRPDGRSAGLPCG